jgi:hypothetical protein
MSLSTNLNCLGNTLSVTTKLTAVWSPVDVAITLCFFHHTLLGLLPFTVSFSSSCSSPNDDLPFGKTKSILLIDTLLLNDAATRDIACEVPQEPQV